MQYNLTTQTNLQQIVQDPYNASYTGKKGTLSSLDIVKQQLVPATAMLDNTFQYYIYYQPITNIHFGYHLVMFNLIMIRLKKKFGYGGPTDPIFWCRPLIFFQWIVEKK